MSEITERDRALATEVYSAAAVLNAAIDAARKAHLRVAVESIPSYIHDGVTGFRLRVNVRRVTTTEFAPSGDHRTFLS